MSALNTVEVQKAALASALDSALNVVYECRHFARQNLDALTPGERDRMAVTLEQMGRLCFSVARDFERRPAPAGGGL